MTALPHWDHEMEHRRTIGSSRPAVWRAVSELTPAQMPVVRALFWARDIPARLRGQQVNKLDDLPFAEGIRQAGFSLLGQIEQEHLEIGRIGKFWQLVPTAGPLIEDPALFAAFAEPGWAKATMTIDLTPAGERATTVAMTTRVAGTDADATRRFGRYWRLMQGGMGLVRVLMLGTIARRARELDG
jgi:hypothetical protein